MRKEPKTLTAIVCRRPGVIACGPYRAGVVYRVPEDIDTETAQRLIDVKGFEPVAREAEPEPVATIREE